MTGVRQPGSHQLAALAQQDAVHVPVGAIAAIPERVEGLPSRVWVGVGVGLRGLGARVLLRPAHHGVAVDLSGHREVDARRHRCDRGDGLERRRSSARGGPGGVAGVAVAEHADAAVAPRLPGDPVDDGHGVFAVVNERPRGALAVGRAPSHIRGDADVAFDGAALRVVLGGIEREAQQRRQGVYRAAGPDHAGMDDDARTHGDLDVGRHRVAAAVFRRDQFGHQHTDGATRLVLEPGVHQRHGVGLRQAALGAPAIEGLPDRLSVHGQRRCEPRHDGRGLRVVERCQQFLERAQVGLGEAEALVRFDRARMRIDAVEDRALDQAIERLALGGGGAGIRLLS